MRRPRALSAKRARARVWNICTTRANHRPECATRTLFGTFPRLEDRTAVSLVRGPATYATGRVSADDRGQQYVILNQGTT